MNRQPSDIVLDFNRTVKEAEVFVSIARDSELQRAACVKLECALAAVSAEKKRAIEQSEEDYANLLLGCQCVATALIAEIKMWLLLKEEMPDEAWDQLVTAQMASVDAVRAHDGFRHVEQNSLRLDAIEALIFPPQVFISSGMIASVQQCSICDEEYEDCPHLIGKPYMGMFCNIIAKGLSADHIAIVEHPADKRCRVIQFGVEGGNRNRMTWRVEPPATDT